jgi:hypothetical protein
MLFYRGNDETFGAKVKDHRKTVMPEVYFALNDTLNVRVQ